MDNLPDQPNNYALDVEDLCEIGTRNAICPYYYARTKLASSDIVIAPYNYILDPELRKTLQVELKNAIIIFDEAHNIDTQCEEMMSFEMTIENYWLALKYIDVFRVQLVHD